MRWCRLIADALALPIDGEAEGDAAHHDILVVELKVIAAADAVAELQQVAAESQVDIAGELVRGFRPELAAPLVEHFCQALRSQGVPTQTGIFAAHMLVEIANDGPVTIWLEK